MVRRGSAHHVTGVIIERKCKLYQCRSVLMDMQTTINYQHIFVVHVRDKQCQPVRLLPYYGMLAFVIGKYRGRYRFSGGGGS